MKYFYDTEFLESGPNVPLYLLSIGIVDENGRELYLQNLDCPLHLASPWVIENVFSGLEHLKQHGGGAYFADDNQRVWQHRQAIVNQITEFVNRGFETPEFWGYYADYDHVLFCQLFGTMMDLPEGW